MEPRSQGDNPSQDSAGGLHVQPHGASKGGAHHELGIPVVPCIGLV